MKRVGLLCGLAWVLFLTTGAASTQATAPADGYRISGKVVNADSGAPVARAEVALLTVVQGMAQDPGDGSAQRQGRQRRRPPAVSALESVTTSDDGSFGFDGLPAGKYSLRGSRRGFISASYQEHGFYSTAVVTGAGIATEGLNLKLSPGASIIGSVIDSGGDPLEQTQVTLYRLSDDGLGSIRTYRSTNADDLGAYEFAHLPPGTYFVSAKAHVWYATYATASMQAGGFGQSGDTAARPEPAPTSNLDLVYPRAFYADASEAGSATPVPVRGGEHLRIDLHLQAVPSVHLTYTPPSNDSPGLHTFSQAPMLFQSVFGERDSAGETVTIRDGHEKETLSMSVAPGEYEVEVAGRILQVNIGGDAVLDAATGTLLTEVSGRVGAAAGAVLPDSVSLTLAPADSHGGQTFSTVAHDGVFHFEQVRAGAYEIEARAQGQMMAVIQAAANGAALEGHVLQVGTQPVTLAATLAPASATLTGFARSSGGERATTSGVDETASGAMIVLVPQHLRDHALYRRDQADSDGSFTLRQIAAGKYTLVAIHDGWDLEWARPEVIAHYLPGGQEITITSASPGSVRVIKPVMVQER